jgi:hypothetical protein
VTTAIAERLAKKLKKHYRIELGSPPEGSMPSVHVKIVSIRDGNAFLRFFMVLLGPLFLLFFSKFCQAHMKIKGDVTSADGLEMPFDCEIRSIGGTTNSSCLKNCGMQAGDWIAKYFIESVVKKNG